MQVAQEKTDQKVGKNKKINFFKVVPDPASHKPKPSRPICAKKNYLRKIPLTVSGGGRRMVGPVNKKKKKS